ncbi:zinc-binding dehydrogenase [Candidatus Saccharibacteria bacterium]|nr:zinc-binding dehydrogenase [Candidatus Saccharibacteria bacterium]
MKGYGMVIVNEAGWLDKPEPTPGPLDAIIRPTLVAPCSSDTHTMHGGAGPKDDLILGHEAIGIIERVGKLVKNFKKGDKVVVPCVTPDWLSTGVQNQRTFSHDSFLMGSFKFLLSKDGTFAELFHVNQADANLVKMPETGVSDEAALMTTDMMSTGFHAAELAEVQYGDAVLVIGIGPVGLMAVAAAQLKGAGRIIAVGTRPICIEVARSYGATDFVNYKEGDVAEQVLQMTDGRGVDRTIIAGGAGDSLHTAIVATRPAGVIASVNFYDINDKLAIPSLAWGLGMSHKDIRGGFCPGGAERIRRMLELIANDRIDPSKLVTHRFYGFDQIPEAFKLMDKKAPDLIKPVVYLDRDDPAAAS